jgi:hypothetical protein
MTTTTTAQDRVCYFCTGNADSLYKIENFVLPMTADSLVSSTCDAVASEATANAAWSMAAGTASTTPFVGAELTAPCSASFLKNSATSISYKGQGVTFTMPSVVNMATGQTVYWASGTVDFQNAGTVADVVGANYLECGDSMGYVNPTVSTTEISVALPFDCAVGDISLVMRGWVDTQAVDTEAAVAASEDCKCFAARAADATAENADLNMYADAAAWTFAAPKEVSGALTLAVNDVSFTPNTMGS